MSGEGREPTNWDWEDREPKHQGITQEEYEKLVIREDQLREEEFEERQRQLEEERKKQIEEQIHNQQQPLQSDDTSLEIGDIYYSELTERWVRVVDWSWDEEKMESFPVVEEVEIEEED